jgi:hypothetical protein
MKSSRPDVHGKFHALPQLRFEDQQLTSFCGLIVVQELFRRLDIKARLRRCFRDVKVTPIFGHTKIVLLLIVHMVLGFRELRDIRYYVDDPLVKRVLGLKRLPDVATISRALSSADEHSVQRLHRLLRELVLVRLSALCVGCVTLDFDGSVIGTSRHAQGTAVGFNRKKKGQRSYYPLFCTVAQTGQVLDVLHRSGNVHDSNGAEAFIRECIGIVKAAVPGVRIEVRMDSAFFSENIISMLNNDDVEYTISVPFERLAALKARIEARHLWHEFSDTCSYFALHWKPKKWKRRSRFLVIRTEAPIQRKGPLQLDLFVPYEYGYEFKVIVTNKGLTAKKMVAFHNGRGSQEGIFAELKSGNTLAYVPCRTWVGNQIYLLCALFAHNLTRELQMIADPPSRRTLEKRPALWNFTRLSTLRRRIIQRAGRLITPQNRLTLSMSANKAVETELLHYLEALKKAA